PLRFAIVRVILTTVLGYLCAIPLPRLLGVDMWWGAAGLTASGGGAGWVELLLLRATLNSRIGHTGLSPALGAQPWPAAVARAARGWAIRLALPFMHPVIAAALILGPYGAVYLGATVGLGLPEARAVLQRAQRRSR